MMVMLVTKEPGHKSRGWSLFWQADSLSDVLDAVRRVVLCKEWIKELQSG